MSSLEARHELERARAAVQEAATHLARAERALSEDVYREAAAHARFDVEHTGKKLDAILNLVRRQVHRARVTPRAARTAPTLPL